MIETVNQNTTRDIVLNFTWCKSYLISLGNFRKITLCLLYLHCIVTYKKKYFFGLWCLNARFDQELNDMRQTWSKRLTMTIFTRHYKKNKSYHLSLMLSSASYTRTIYELIVRVTFWLNVEFYFIVIYVVIHGEPQVYKISLDFADGWHLYGKLPPKTHINIC